MDDRERLDTADNAIIGGTAVTDPVGEGLVRITSEIALGRPPATGSGVLLTPEWTLTAAHTLYPEHCQGELPGAPFEGNTRATCRFMVDSKTRVTLGNRGATPAPEDRTPSRISVHPSYSPRLVGDDIKQATADVALIQTSPFSGLIVNRTINGAAPPPVGTTITCFAFGRSAPVADGGVYGTANKNDFTAHKADQDLPYPFPNFGLSPVVAGNILIGGDSGGFCTLKGDRKIVGVVRDNFEVTGGDAIEVWANGVMNSVEDINYDWNGDGKPDALFWKPDATNTNLELLWQSEGYADTLTKTWATIAISRLGDLSTFRSAVGDFDGNGELDVVASTATNSFYLIAPATAGGTLTEGAAPVRKGAHDMLVADDVDGRGPDDIRVFDAEGRQWVHFGLMDPANPRPTSFQAIAHTLVDLTGDGADELAIFGLLPGGNPEMRYLYNDGRLRLGSAHSESVVRYTPSPQLIAGHFNNDAREDVALYMHVYENLQHMDRVWYCKTSIWDVPSCGAGYLHNSAQPSHHIEVADFLDPEDPANPSLVVQDILVVNDDQSAHLYWGTSTSTGPTPGNSTPVGALPTPSARDGRLLTLSGKGASTFKDPYLEFRLSSSSPRAVVQVFDGDYGGAQDNVWEANDTCFQVWDDPCGARNPSCGLGDPILLTDSVTVGSTLPDNQWKTIFSGTQAARPGLNGGYHYRVIAYLSRTGRCDYGIAEGRAEADASVPAGLNAFKIRASGFLSYQYGDLQIVGRGLDWRHGNFGASAPGFLRASEYDGTFSFWFDVSDLVNLPLTDPNHADIRLSEADADYVGDATPGVGHGASNDIRFALYPPGASDSVALSSTAADGSFLELLDPWVIDPSGNFDGVVNEAGGKADQEYYMVPHPNEVPGRWRWDWSNVRVVNNIHIWAPMASPVSYELFGAPVPRPLLTSARPIPEWTALGTDFPGLPWILGSLNAQGLPAGESILVETQQAAEVLLAGEEPDPWAELERQLLVAKLNLAKAAGLGERLGEALLEGGRISPRTVVARADALVRGPRVLQSTQDVETMSILLGALNKGQVTYFRPGLPLSLEPGSDQDGDGLMAVEDNCPPFANPGQEDSDGDSIGDACGVTPLLDCVLPTGPDSHRAYLGYDNPIEFRSIPLGPRNEFDPGPIDRDQPREFVGGVFPHRFSVELLGSDPVRWLLDGASLSIGPDGPPCSGIELIRTSPVEGVVIYGSEEVLVGNAATVQAVSSSGGVLLSGGGLELGARAQVGEVWAREDVVVGANARIAGPAVAGGSFTQAARCTITGPIVEGGYVPSHSLAWFVAFPEGGQPARVAPRRSMLIEPGAYSDVQVRGTLRLESGVYFFNSLELSAPGTLVLDGSITVYVRDQLTLDGSGTIEQVGTGALLLGYLGSEPATVTAAFRGDLIAPSATLLLGSAPGSVHQGRFFAHRVELQAGSTVRGP